MSRVVFTGANLLDGTHPARAGTSVAVEGERIVAVGPDGAFRARPGDRAIALAGRTLLPGLATCHFHATFDAQGLERFPFGLDQPPGILMLRAARNARRALDCGFTMAVGAGGGDAIDAQLALAIDQGLASGPRLLPCSRNLGTTSGYIDLEPWWYRLGNTGSCRMADGPDAFRHAVRDEIRQGARILKLFVTGGHGNVREGTRELSREELAAVVETAHARGALVRAHCAWKREMLECIELGVDLIDHGDELDAELIDAMAAAGTFLDPGLLYLEKLLAYEPLRDAPGFADAREAAARELENLARRLPEAQAAGVRLLLGDDHGAVILPHGHYAEELEFYVKRIGLAPLDVLRWATRNAAALFGREGELGTVEVGALADLLVVDGDPSADVSLLSDPARLVAILRGGAFVKDALGS